MKSLRKSLSVLMALLMVMSCVSAALTVFATNASAGNLTAISNAFGLKDGAGNYIVKTASRGGGSNASTFQEIPRNDANGIPSGTTWAAVKAFAQTVDQMKITTAAAPTGNSASFNVAVPAENNIVSIGNKLNTQLQTEMGAANFNDAGMAAMWTALLGNPNYQMLSSTAYNYEAGKFYFPAANGNTLPNNVGSDITGTTLASTVTVNRTMANVLEPFANNLDGIPTNAYLSSTVTYTHTIKCKDNNRGGTPATHYWHPWHYITGVTITDNAGAAVATDKANLQAYKTFFANLDAMDLSSKTAAELNALADQAAGPGPARTGGHRGNRAAWNAKGITDLQRQYLGMQSDAVVDALITELLLAADVAAYGPVVDYFHKDTTGKLFYDYTNDSLADCQALRTQAIANLAFLNNLRDPLLGLDAARDYLVTNNGLNFTAIENWLKDLTHFVETWELREEKPWFETAILTDVENLGATDLVLFWRDFYVHFNRVFGTGNYTLDAKTEVFGSPIVDGDLWKQILDVKARLDAMEVSEAGYSIYVHFMALNLDANIAGMTKADLLAAINNNIGKYNEYLGMTAAARNSMFTAAEQAKIVAFMEGVYDEAVFRCETGFTAIVGAWSQYGGHVTQMNYKILKNALDITLNADNVTVSVANFRHIDALDYYAVLRAADITGTISTLRDGALNLGNSYKAFVNYQGLYTYPNNTRGGVSGHFQSDVDYPSSVYRVGNIIRVEGSGLVYEVTEDKVDMMIQKLDALLGSPMFGKLLAELGIDLTSLFGGGEEETPAAPKPCCHCSDCLCTPGQACLAACDCCENCEPPVQGPVNVPVPCCKSAACTCVLGQPCLFECPCNAGPCDDPKCRCQYIPGMPAVQFPNIDAAYAASLGQMLTRQSPNRPAVDATTNPLGKTQHYIQADNSDVFISLLRWVFKAVSDEKFLVTLMGLLTDIDIPGGPAVPCCLCENCICPDGGACDKDCPCIATCPFNCRAPQTPPDPKPPKKCCDGPTCICLDDGTCPKDCPCNCAACKSPQTPPDTFCCDCTTCICPANSKSCDLSCGCCDKCKNASFGDVLSGALGSFLNDDLLTTILMELYPMLEEQLASYKTMMDLVSLTPNDIKIWYTPKQVASCMDAARFPKVVAALNAIPGDSWANKGENFELDWELPDPTAANYMDEYVRAIGNVFSGLTFILKCAFANKTYSYTKNILAGVASVKLDMARNRGYLYSGVPLLEGLMIADDKIMDVATFESTFANDSTGYADAVGMFNQILLPVLKWATVEMPKAPISTICKVLPNLAWMMELGMLGPGIKKALATSIHIKADYLWGLGNIADETLDVGAMLPIDDLFESLGVTDINSINGLLGGIFGLILGDDADPNGQIPPGAIDDSMKEIINGIIGDPDQTICALVELFQPQPYPVTPVTYTQPEITKPVDQGDGTLVPGNKVIYTEIWTKNHAKYLDIHMDEFINNAVKLFLGKSFEDLVNELLGTSAYTNANVQMIVDMVNDLLGGLGDTLDLVGPLLNVPIADLAYNAANYPNCVKPVTPFEDGDKDGFINALVTLLDPAVPLIEFLLNSRDLKILPGLPIAAPNDSLIRAIGYDGYTNAVLPLLTALGCTGIKSTAQFQAEAQADSRSVLTNLINPIFSLLDQVVQNPTQAIMNLAPNLLYVMQEGILAKCVSNLLHPVFVLLDVVRPIYNLDINSMLSDLIPGIDLNIQNLDLMPILNNLLAGLGLNLPPVEDIFNKFLVGSWEPYTDANGNTAYRMVADRADLITQLMRFLVNVLVYPNNTDAIKDLVKEMGALDEQNLQSVYGLLDKFQPMSVDAVLYVLFYVFFGLEYSVDAGNAAIEDANKWLKEVSEYINNDAKSPSFKYAGSVTRELMNKYFKDIVEPGPGVAPNGLLAFFQAILDFFKRLFGIK